MINQQDITNITASLNPDYAALITSDFPQQSAKLLGRKHDLSADQTEALGDGITLYLLGVYTKGNLSSYITNTCDLSPEVSENLLTALLTILPTNFEQLQESAYRILHTEPSSQSVAPASATVASLTTSAPHIRTMADDMTKSQAAGEHVYTSTQEAILKEGWSTPKPTPPQSS